MLTLKKIISLSCFFIFLAMFSSEAQERTNPKNQDEELGMVSWYRDFNTATKLSEEKNKPIFILFQEVPGCATCRNYGHNVLSNPLLVEAIENEFIPLAIFNNKGGKDKQILEKYNEPTWNNPVVRIVDKNGANLTKRISGDYSAIAVQKAMVAVLTSEGKEIPAYLILLGEELKSKKLGAVKESYFSMYCFWTGEKQLGSNDGVINTEAGFMKGREVVKVTYNPERITPKRLANFALANDMKPLEKDASYRASAKDEDYYLQHSAYKYLPLSELQRTKINSALGNRKSAEHLLSPKQLQWLQQVSSLKTSVRFNQDFKTAWKALNSNS